MINDVEIDECMRIIDEAIDKIKMKLDNGVGWNIEDKMNAYT